jgi:hypothetical protein
LETSVRSATDLTIRLALSAFVQGLVRLVVGRNIAARPRAPIHAGEGPARRGADPDPASYLVRNWNCSRIILSR